MLIILIEYVLLLLHPLLIITYLEFIHVLIGIHLHFPLLFLFLIPLTPRHVDIRHANILVPTYFLFLMPPSIIHAAPPVICPHLIRHVLVLLTPIPVIVGESHHIPYLPHAIVTR